MPTEDATPSWREILLLPGQVWGPGKLIEAEGPRVSHTAMPKRRRELPPVPSPL